ncbi:MAG TPA: type II toxin-antitoxin system prevent-host-death family antitoxin [Luteimonas sp.]|nr:type II toxin-antitoxin system prevent-host-death family antitoxin [Luteimonas sp.]
MSAALQDVLKLTGADTPVHPASAVKASWPAIVRDVARHGEVIVTHHNRPEVVLVDVAAYADLVRRAEANDPLKMLAAEFDRRLAVLDGVDGNARLRAAAAAGLGAQPAARAAGGTRRAGAAAR